MAGGGDAWPLKRVFSSYQDTQFLPVPASTIRGSANRLPTHTRLTQRWVKQGDERAPVEKRQRVKPWWQTDVSGHLVMTVRFGSRPIEFEKGKAGIAVPSKDKLVPVIETLISAVRNGELDDLLTQASKQRVPQKTRKVA